MFKITINKSILFVFLTLFFVSLVPKGELFFKENLAYAASPEEIKKHEEKWGKYYDKNPSDLSPELLEKISSDTIESVPYQSIGVIFVQGETSATGIYIGKNTVMTNYHVAREAKKDPSKVLFLPGKREDSNGIGTHLPYGFFTAEEIDESPFGTGIDIALIKFGNNSDGQSLEDVIQPAEFGNTDEVHVGDEISLIGYPYNFDDRNMYRSQIEVQENSPFFKYYGYTVQGSSGSGIFDLQGKLVGIHVGKLYFHDKDHVINHGILINNIMEKRIKMLIK